VACNLIITINWLNLKLSHENILKDGSSQGPFTYAKQCVCANSRDIVGRIAARLRVGRRRNVMIPGRNKRFLSSLKSRSALQTTQPPNQRTPRAPSPVVRQPERDADHSPPFTADVRMSVAILYYFQFETTTNKTVVCVITGSYFSNFEDCCFLSTSLFVLSRTDDVTAVPCFQKHEKPFPDGCF
jgi:hypothetical protein